MEKTRRCLSDRIEVTRFYFGILTSAFLSYHCCSASLDNLDVWILAGQSNMQGDNRLDPSWSDMPPCGEPWPEKIFSFLKPNVSWTGKKLPPDALSNWVVAKPNVCWYAMHHQEAESLGPEMAFAKVLIEKGASSKIGFVPFTLGGSSLYYQWLSNDTDLKGMLVALVLRAMEVAGPGARLRGMVWVQGEGDATIAAGITNAAMYAENLKKFIIYIRQELALHHPLLPIIIGVQATTDRDRVLPHIHLIRRHQMELELPSLIKADMEGMPMYPMNFSEIYGPSVGLQSLHITKAGQCLFGRALAEAFLRDYGVVTGDG